MDSVYIKKTFVLLLICTIFSCQKLQEINDIQKENGLVGFACQFAGVESKPVENITIILQNKDFYSIKKKLWSVSTAEKYLATIACERLDEKSKIKLTKNELNQIEINKSSDEEVSICEGCANREELTLNELFSSKGSFLSIPIEEWLNEMIN